jgi:hypothetical protein
VPVASAWCHNHYGKHWPGPWIQPAPGEGDLSQLQELIAVPRTRIELGRNKAADSESPNPGLEGVASNGVDGLDFNPKTYVSP